jgi:hypothetical protein
MHQACLAWFIGAALLGPVAAQTVDLAVAAKKGDRAAFVYTQSARQAIDLAGQEMTAAQDLAQELDLTVLDVGADGTLTVEFRVARIRGSVQMPTVDPVAFDSKPAAGRQAGEPGAAAEEPSDAVDMPVAAALDTLVRALVDRAFTATVERDGTVVKVAGASEAIDAAKAKAGDGAAVLHGLLTEDGMKRMVAAAFGERPKAAIAAGDGWDGRTQADRGRSIPTIHKPKFTLAKVDAGEAEITVAGAIELLQPAAEVEGEGEAAAAAAARRQMLANAKIENATIAGAVALSRRDGFVLRAEVKSAWDVKGLETPDGDMRIAVTSTTTCVRQPRDSERAKPAAGK